MSALTQYVSGKESIKRSHGFYTHGIFDWRCHQFDDQCLAIGSQRNSFKPCIHGRFGYTNIVEDNGIGMSEQVKKQALTPFFTTKAQGTGLGLAVVFSV